MASTSRAMTRGSRRVFLQVAAILALQSGALSQTIAVADLSSWFRDSSADTSWVMMKSNMSSPYYYVDGTTNAGVARLLSPNLSGKGTTCVTLSYFLSGSANDSLRVGSSSSSSAGANGSALRTVAFHREADAAAAAAVWNVDVDVDVVRGEQLFIEGETARGGDGYIAIANVTYVDGSCRAARDERRVTCNETHMRVHIPGSDASRHFYFYNSPCRLAFDGAAHEASVALNSCGLRSRAANDSTVYYGHVIEVSEDDEIFDAEEDLPVLVECVYGVKGVVSGDVSFDAVAASPSKTNQQQQLTGRPPSNVTGVALLQYSTSDYKTPIAPDQYPLAVKLGASMYFQLKAVGGNTEAVQVGIRSCRAFSQDRSKEHYLIKNGCLLNKSLKFLNTESDSEKRFTVKSFSLLGSEGPVLMECEAVVCDKGYGACAPCVSKRRTRDVRANELSSHVISVGPVVARS